MLGSTGLLKSARLLRYHRDAGTGEGASLQYEATGKGCSLIQPACRRAAQHPGAMWPTAPAGIAPYMAMELASYDLLSDRIPSFARGFSAALLATSICYPLDTVR